MQEQEEAEEVRLPMVGVPQTVPRHLKRQRQRLVEKLEALGVKVTIEEVVEAA